MLWFLVSSLTDLLQTSSRARWMNKGSFRSPQRPTTTARPTLTCRPSQRKHRRAAVRAEHVIFTCGEGVGGCTKSVPECLPNSCVWQLPDLYVTHFLAPFFTCIKRGGLGWGGKTCWWPRFQGLFWSDSHIIMLLRFTSDWNIKTE